MLSRLTVLGVSCTLTMSSCLAALMDSMPGRAAAIFRNRACGRAWAAGEGRQEVLGSKSRGGGRTCMCVLVRRCSDVASAVLVAIALLKWRSGLQTGWAYHSAPHLWLLNYHSQRNISTPALHAISSPSTPGHGIPCHASSSSPATHLDVEPCFRAGLDEVHVELPCLGVSLLDGYLPVRRGGGRGRWMARSSSAWSRGL